jgi:hypothetical protein
MDSNCDRDMVIYSSDYSTGSSASSSSSSSSSSDSCQPVTYSYENEDDAVILPSQSSIGTPFTKPEETNFASQMYQWHFRGVDRVEKHFGGDDVDNLCTNIGQVTLLSLYSGLGGSELSASSVHLAATKKQLSRGKCPPPKPKFAVACDVNESCQAVLKSHKEPIEHIVPDIFAFVSPSTLDAMKQLGEAHAKNNAHLRARESGPAASLQKKTFRVKTKGTVTTIR